MLIGILAYQGAFAKHHEMLTELNCHTLFVRSAEELFSCDALIIPGGESTVIRKQMEKANLQESLALFAKAKPIFGTCAGLILLAQERLLDVSVERNAYGSQLDSFSTPLTLQLPAHKATVEAIFIRAPKVVALLSPQVEVLATYQEAPVFVKQGHILGCSFHPELTKDRTIHQYFVEEVKHARSGKKRSLLGHRESYS